MGTTINFTLATFHSEMLEIYLTFMNCEQFMKVIAVANYFGLLDEALRSTP